MAVCWLPRAHSTLHSSTAGHGMCCESTLAVEFLWQTYRERTNTTTDMQRARRHQATAIQDTAEAQEAAPASTAAHCGAVSRRNSPLGGGEARKVHQVHAVARPAQRGGKIQRQRGRSYCQRHLRLASPVGSQTADLRRKILAAPKTRAAHTASQTRHTSPHSQGQLSRYQHRRARHKAAGGPHQVVLRQLP